MTTDQAAALTSAAEEVPQGIELVIASADSGESHDYADQIRLALKVSRVVGTLFGWHPKGIVIAVHSETDIASLSAQRLGFELKQAGLLVDHVEVDTTHTHAGEILIAVGEE